ncbi:hypothetical protein ACOMHN_018031 [Nucella lapillus]
MSSRCQCPFSGPADTILGCHRDPISSEKGWLDFAVRELSRVAAGKARGQEAVWRSQCKPDWWDSVCPHPWKNPTANPKDCKDTLKVKFECLVQHLRKRDQLPRELEEEVQLWEGGRRTDVFLMTFFSSLLGQASKLHSLLDHTAHKMHESGVTMDMRILAYLQTCLTACVSRLQTMRHMDTPVSGASRKRQSCDTDPPSPSSPKRLKPSSLLSPPLPSSSSTTSSSPVPSLVQSSPPTLSSPPHPALTPSPQVSVDTDDSSRILLAALQKHLLEKQVGKTADTRSPVGQVFKSQAALKPRARPVLTHTLKGSKKRRGVGQNSIAQGPSVGTLPSVCLSATAPCLSPAPRPSPAPHPSPVPDFDSAEITDFLELDLEGQDGVADCQVLNDFPFLDSLLLGPCSSDLSGNTNTTAVVPCSVAPPTPAHSPPSTHMPVDCQNNSVNNISNHDLFTGHSDLSESSLFDFELSKTVAGQQTKTGMAEGGIGTVPCSGVGEVSMGVQDSEVISESGYNSESAAAVSHRGSLDSETSEVGTYSDLCSPDLEAYLDSLNV